LLVVSASDFLPPSLDAITCDCDGVLLEAEHLHRQDYNDAFVHFGKVWAAMEGTWPGRGGAVAVF
jgi:beta-phosphoglucomutase-like phosphatase (HAD superfamily)